MEWEELVDRYRSLKLAKRVAICVALGAIYPAYAWFEDDATLSIDLEKAKGDLQAEEDNIKAKKAKVQKLPKLQDEKAEVERALEKAKRYLPDTVEMDEVLAKVGALESEFKIKIAKLETREPIDPKEREKTAAPGGPPAAPPPAAAGTPPAADGAEPAKAPAKGPAKKDEEPSLYLEIPLEVTVQSDFNRIMLFYDALVHQDRLVHLRNLEFQFKGLASDKKTVLASNAQLILFKSNGNGPKKGP